MREYQSGTADASGNATFGPGLVFEGKLSFQGQVRFDGTFTGEITTDDLLIIGETAKVSADITCGSVVINGEVNGKIKARDSVELRGHARVKADVVTPSLVALALTLRGERRAGALALLRRTVQGSVSARWRGGSGSSSALPCSAARWPRRPRCC